MGEPVRRKVPFTPAWRVRVAERVAERKVLSKLHEDFAPILERWQAAQWHPPYPLDTELTTAGRLSVILRCGREPAPQRLLTINVGQDPNSYVLGVTVWEPLRKACEYDAAVFETVAGFASKRFGDLEQRLPMNPSGYAQAQYVLDAASDDIWALVDDLLHPRHFVSVVSL